MQTPSEPEIDAARRKEVIDLLQTGKRAWTLRDLVAAGDADTRSLLMDSGTPLVYTPTIKAMGMRLDRIAELALWAERLGWVQSAKVRQHHRTHDFDTLGVRIGPLTALGESALAEAAHGRRPTSNPVPHDLIRQKEAAAILKCDPKTIREYINQGKLDGYIPGRRVSERAVRALQNAPAARRKKRTP